MNWAIIHFFICAKNKWKLIFWQWGSQLNVNSFLPLANRFWWRHLSHLCSLLCPLTYPHPCNTRSFIIVLNETYSWFNLWKIQCVSEVIMINQNGYPDSRLSHDNYYDPNWTNSFYKSFCTLHCVMPVTIFCSHHSWIELIFHILLPLSIISIVILKEGSSMFN